MTAVMEKRPDEVLDYVFDFSRWLTSADRITSATVSVTHSPTTGTATIDRVLFDNTTATAWVSAGVSGETAEIVMMAVTLMGRTKDATLRLRIKA